MQGIACLFSVVVHSRMVWCCLSLQIFPNMSNICFEYVYVFLGVSVIAGWMEDGGGGGGWGQWVCFFFVFFWGGGGGLGDQWDRGVQGGYGVSGFGGLGDLGDRGIGKGGGGGVVLRNVWTITSFSGTSFQHVQKHKPFPCFLTFTKIISILEITQIARSRPSKNTTVATHLNKFKNTINVCSYFNGFI